MLKQDTISVATYTVRRPLKRHTAGKKGAAGKRTQDPGFSTSALTTELRHPVGNHPVPSPYIDHALGECCWQQSPMDSRWLPMGCRSSVARALTAKARVMGLISGGATFFQPYVVSKVYGQ